MALRASGLMELRAVFPLDLRLYVAGSSVLSHRALCNLRQILQQHFPRRHRLMVIDVYQQPQLATEDQIIAAPTLIRRLPGPVRRWIGDLSDPRLLEDLRLGIL